MGDGGRNVDYNVLERILARSEEPRHLPLEILTSITDNFSQDRKIASGGFSDVYKGVLHHWSVAVKRIRVDIHTMDDKLFNREVRSLLRIKHPNVVRFLGFYSNTHQEAVKENAGAEKRRLVEIRERLLCFEYISNGSLETYITDELRGLEWNIRYQIIKGICEGLQYLHNEMDIIHMDLKPANIMVDTDDKVPKITDFGLARLGENKYTTGDRFFSRGYCAPEYINIGKTTSECDIYSLGVIIKEIVTGRNEIPNKDRVIRRWRCRWRKSATYTPLYVRQITKCIEIAERCTQKEPENRPSISHIIHYLKESANTNVYIPAVDQIPSLDYDDMLGIEPLELRFAFEVNKEISNAVELTNETGNCVAFNIKTVSELNYLAQPNKGIVLPQSKNIVKITLQTTQGRTTLRSMPRANEFIVQSTKVVDGLTDEEITEDMFNDEAGRVVDEVNLTVVYDDGPAEEPQADQSLEANAPVVPEETKQRARGTKRQRHINFHPTLEIASTRNVNTAMALETETVSALTGAMGSLRPKLLELLDEDYNLERSVKECLEVLERQMERMHAGLNTLSQVQRDQLYQEDKVWAKQVRELSYVIEDMVDELIISMERSEPMITTDLQHSLKERIENIITVRVKEVADYKVRNYVDNTHHQAISNVIDPRIPVLHKDHKELVGIDGPRDALVQRLYGDNGCCPKQQLQVISIFGDGGLGKTTLAKTVYDMIAKHNNLKAFVSVGRKPDTMQVLKSILYQLTKETCADIGDATLLINKVRHVLENKRYLIVIDDIWDTESWNIIQCAFIDNGKGSRVITTSRIFEVAKNSGEVCKLEPLSYEHSKELFYAKLTNKGTSTSDQQPDEKSTKYILGKCGGLPLAIITIASLLVREPVEDWSEVYTRIGFGHNDTRAENTNKILLFSYNELPCHLKTCLLYLSIFPEDDVVEKNTLVWKWVAEGFVHEERGKTLFEVGEGYFNHLINRSIIQPLEETGSWSDEFAAPLTIRACRVHDMVLDLIRAIAKEENFVTILDCGEQHLSSQFGRRKHSSSQTKARILAAQKTKLEQHDLAYICKQKVTRSFSATSDARRMAAALDSLLSSLQVLHVLCLEGVQYARLLYRDFAMCIPTSLAGLHHLRYLGLHGLRIRELPKEIGALLSLLVLDLRDNDIKELPQSITLLRKLKCLLCDTRRGVPVKLPDGMGSLTSMEELQVFLHVGYEPYKGNLGTELGKLTELRVLRINIFGYCGVLIDALVKSLNKLKKMEELDIYHSSDSDGDGPKPKPWHGYSPCRRLRHLRMVNGEPPVWFNPSLRNITHLCLYVESATDEHLDSIGSLPELRSLILPISRDKDHTTFTAGGFPKLRYLHITSSPTFQRGAMPCLESLVFLVNARSNVDFNFDSLHYLPLLEKVSAIVYFVDVTTEEAESIKAAVSRAVDTHANRPTLDLEQTGFCTDYTYDERLESLMSSACDEDDDDYESNDDDDEDDQEYQMD